MSLVDPPVFSSLYTSCLSSWALVMVGGGGLEPQEEDSTRSSRLRVEYPLDGAFVVTLENKEK